MPNGAVLRSGMILSWTLHRATSGKGNLGWVPTKGLLSLKQGQCYQRRSIFFAGSRLPYTMRSRLQRPSSQPICTSNPNFTLTA